MSSPSPCKVNRRSDGTNDKRNSWKGILLVAIGCVAIFLGAWVIYYAMGLSATAISNLAFAYVSLFLAGAIMIAAGAYVSRMKSSK